MRTDGLTRMRRVSTEVRDRVTLAYSKPAWQRSKVALEKEPWLLYALGLPTGPTEMAVLGAHCSAYWVRACVRLQASPFTLPEQSLEAKSPPGHSQSPNGCVLRCVKFGGGEENVCSCGVIPVDSTAGGDL